MKLHRGWGPSVWTVYKHCPMLALYSPLGLSSICFPFADHVFDITQLRVFSLGYMLVSCQFVLV